MTLKNLNRIIFIISLLGLLVSGYLLEKYLTGGRILCGVSAGCEVVRASNYSNFLGIPIPIYGAVYYLGVIFLVILNTLSKILDYKYRMILLLYSFIGTFASVVLFYIEINFIHAICLWCTISGIFTVLLPIIVIYCIIKAR